MAEKMRTFTKIALAFFLIAAWTLVAAQQKLIDAGKLERNGAIAKKIRSDIRKTNYVIKSQRGENELPDLVFFSYKANAEEKFWDIISRCGLDADTLISVNKLSNPKEIYGKTLFLPNMRGVIVRLSEKNTLEKICAEFKINPQYVKHINRDLRNDKETVFIPMGRISSSERQNFLNAGFSAPLQNKRIRFTSGYGTRKDPLNHENRFHGGIDIGCPEGTPVKAIKDGAVKFAQTDDGYGKVIILSHPNGYESVYGHLSQIKVEEGQNVQKGDVIAYSGNTGRTTGPHLHFEVRKFGKPLNPRHFVK